MGDNDEELGATGQFPDGKINRSDEGELRIAMAHKDGSPLLLGNEGGEGVRG
jgi:hypothetical protein